jgi:hypothetical protein
MLWKITLIEIISKPLITLSNKQMENVLIWNLYGVNTIIHLHLMDLKVNKSEQAWLIYHLQQEIHLNFYL